jgi:hypothetical protein
VCVINLRIKYKIMAVAVIGDTSLAMWWDDTAAMIAEDNFSIPVTVRGRIQQLPT